MLRLAAVCLSTVCSTALAQVTASAKAEALQAFESLQGAADAQFERCREAARTVFLQGDANWDCMQSGKMAVSGRYAEVKGRVAGDQGIVAALEDYAASALTAFDDLRPRNLELAAGYEARVGALQSDLRRKANIVRLRMQ
jgi:hypothetical protein